MSNVIGAMFHALTPSTLKRDKSLNISFVRDVEGYTLTLMNTQSLSPGGAWIWLSPYLSEIVQKSIANQGFRRDLGMKIQPSGKQRCVINFQKYQIEYDRPKTLCNICFIKNYMEVVHLFLIRIICGHRDKVKPEIKIHIVD